MEDLLKMCSVTVGGLCAAFGLVAVVTGALSMGINFPGIEELAKGTTQHFDNSLFMTVGGAVATMVGGTFMTLSLH